MSVDGTKVLPLLHCFLVQRWGIIILSKKPPSQRIFTHCSAEVTVRNCTIALNSHSTLAVLAGVAKN